MPYDAPVRNIRHLPEDVPLALSRKQSAMNRAALARKWSFSMKRIYIFMVFGLASAMYSATPGLPVLKGFSVSRNSWERDFEQRLVALPKPTECGELLRALTRTPHVAGTPANERVARLIADEYRKAGLEVEMPSYDVLLSYPKSATIEIIGERHIRLGRPEEPVAGDPDTHSAEAAIPWCAYSPTCDLVSDVVYVNRGSPADYDQLARMGIDVKGKIALARYFGGYRGGKGLEAEKRGVAAVLAYSDPIDDGWFRGDVYPAGPWGPDSHFQRGSNVYDFIIPGDPLTPGWASIPDARRIDESESKSLPKVPMMPLSARDAAMILKRLKGPVVPDGWQGVALPAAYHIGPGPVKVHLKIENTRERRTIIDVIGVLKGTDEPERTILLSNHHDAWVYGAVDPCSGTAALVSLARAFGQLARDGWKPRRTIMFGSWDAEEYTLTGSTEWGEEHQDECRKNVAICINIDSATSGREFTASASPLLFGSIRDVAHDIDDPGAAGRSVADTWRETSGRTNIRSYATGATGEDLPISILGSGSDYTVFFNRLGVPSADMLFDGPYGVYHSIYDDDHWMETQGDPGFLYHAAMAKLVGVLALRFANADVLPLSASTYGREIARYAEELAVEENGKLYASELHGMETSAHAWSEAAGKAEESIARRLASGKMPAAEITAANEWLMSLERALLAEDGLPGRPWFRHLIYAPLPSYEAETLPVVREAIDAAKADEARAGIRELTGKLDQATSHARQLIGVQ